MLDGYLFYLVYFCCLVFFSAILTRFLRIKTTPIHLRWELYPVPHEGSRSSYGGSRLEETDWWEKPQKKNFLKEVFVMAQEIALLKGVFEHNKRLWLGSFPFHFGLYLLVANAFAAVCLGIYNTAVADIVSAPPQLLGGVVFPAMYVLAFASCILCLVGALYLLARRVLDPNLRLYSSPSHYFNLLAFVALSVTGLLWAASDSNFATSAVRFVSSQLTLVPISSIAHIPVAGQLHIGIILLLMVYLPFTHMSHFFMKYFTYHSVRWDDASFRNDPKAKAKLARQLEQPVTWSAPHIMADGRKNWIVITGEDPTKK